MSGAALAAPQNLTPTNETPETHSTDEIPALHIDQTEPLVAPPPAIGTLTKWRYYAGLAFRYYFAEPALAKRIRKVGAEEAEKNPPWLARWAERGKRSLLAKIKKQVEHQKGGFVREVPHVLPEDVTPETFRKFHVAHSPVVLKGFMKDTGAVEKWTLPWFRDNYGDERVRAAKTKEGMFFRGDPGLDIRFGEGIERMLSGERIYMFGYSDVLINNPELVKDDLDIKRLSGLCNPKYAVTATDDPFGVQLFIGGPRSGTSMHCASATNLFMMIHGTKKWTLAPPPYTPYLDPVLHPDAIYCDSPIDIRKSQEELDEEGYELWRHTPRYEAHLEPGDVLFNPGWWWHWVDNTSDTSLAVGHRFLSNKIMAGNPYLQSMVMANFHACKVLFSWMFFNKRATDADILNRLFPSEHADPKKKS